MEHATASSGDRLAVALHSSFRALPIACFPLALASDVAYSQTSNLLWLHFSEWLLFAGIIGAVLELLGTAIDMFARKLRPTWPAIVMGIVVLALAFINNLVHTRDGWTAVVPLGLTLSALTVIAIVLTAWFGRKGYRYV